MEELLKNSRKRMIVIRFFKAIELLLMMVLFAACWIQYYEPLLLAPYSWYASTLTILFYAVVLMYTIKVYKGFELGSYRVSEIVYSQSLGVIITNGFFAIIFFFLLKSRFIAAPLLILSVIETLIAMVWALCMNKLYFAITPPKKTVIAYRKESDIKKLRQIRFFDRKYDVQKMILCPTDYHDVADELDGIDVVFTSGIDPAVRNGIVKYCINNSILCYVAPKVGDMILEGAEHMQMFGLPIMRVRRATIMPEYAIIKRAFDVVGSLLALIISGPISLAAALAIKCYDHGPVFYKQTRLTKNAKPFEILKFRSMKIDAEKDGIARLASENDDRITPIGKIIRGCRIDELPQLLNILKGDMTIVGPRPERPEIAQQYRELNSAFDLRLQVKAGLTGYAQVYGKYNTDPYDKLQLDLIYINSMSIAVDFKLILATVKTLFMKESTEGVRAGETTAGEGVGEAGKSA